MSLSKLPIYAIGMRVCWQVKPAMTEKSGSAAASSSRKQMAISRGGHRRRRAAKERRKGRVRYAVGDNETVSSDNIALIEFAQN
ncbi:MAG: hypothetical protein FWG25_00995 [Promicromonosporaceae bacterium]|nr:hypothetical protein [Promicromonosporaceae bacterium]